MNIDEMPAGREMNDLIAIEVMGWHREGSDWRNAENKWMAYTDDVNFEELAWSPCDHIADAWEVARVMQWWKAETDLSEDGSVMWHFRTGQPPEHKWFSARAPKNQEPLAICRAALKVARGDQNMKPYPQPSHCDSVVLARCVGREVRRTLVEKRCRQQVDECLAKIECCLEVKLEELKELRFASGQALALIYFLEEGKPPENIHRPKQEIRAVAEGHLTKTGKAKMRVGWTKEWPTCPGYYWFYGWCFRSRHRKPELHFVKIRQIVNGVMRVTNGHFLYKAEGGDGYWLPAIVPMLPNESYNSLVEQMGGEALKAGNNG